MQHQVLPWKISQIISCLDASVCFRRVSSYFPSIGLFLKLISRLSFQTAKSYGVNCLTIITQNTHISRSSITCNWNRWCWWCGINTVFDTKVNLYPNKSTNYELDLRLIKIDFLFFSVLVIFIICDTWFPWILQELPKSCLILQISLSLIFGFCSSHSLARHYLHAPADWVLCPRLFECADL